MHASRFAPFPFCAVRFNFLSPHALMPLIRTDIVDVYIFRRSAPAGTGADTSIEFLQLLRTGGPAAGAWHPVMGHIEGGESATACAQRELAEEVGLQSGDAHLIGLWSLEQVHPYYVPQWDAIVMSPRFAAEVSQNWSPKLNAEHSRFRWVQAIDADRHFIWPGQHAAIREITRDLLRPGSLLLESLRIRP